MPKSALQFVHDLAEAIEAATRAKITSGELMVVKKARFVLPEKHTDYGYCSECKKPVDMSKQPVPFFHTCGAEIVK